MFHHLQLCKLWRKVKFGGQSFQLKGLGCHSVTETLHIFWKASVRLLPNKKIQKNLNNEVHQIGSFDFQILWKIQLVFPENFWIVRQYFKFIKYYMIRSGFEKVGFSDAYLLSYISNSYFGVHEKEPSYKYKLFQKVPI